MSAYLFILLLLNLITLDKYMKYQLEGGVSYKNQLLIDFIGPFGAIVGRWLCKFKIKENPRGYIFGIFFDIFILLLVITFSI